MFSPDSTTIDEVYAAHGALAQCRVEAFRSAPLEGYPWLKGRMEHLRLGDGQCVLLPSLNRLHRDRLAEALGQLRRQCRSVDPRERARSIDGRVEREDRLRDGEGEERAGEELGAAQG